jgi:hypothetical protein
MEVGDVDPVNVDDADVPDAPGRQREPGRTTEAARADNQYF